MKKICFLGSNGFLAKAFGEYYMAAENVELHVFGRTKPSYNHKIFNILDLNTPKLDFSFLNNFNIIFYFAGEGVQSNKVTNDKNIFNINTIVPIELCLYLESNTYKGSFITFGSYAEIGANNQHKYFNEYDIIESRLPVPNNYTVSKRVFSKFVDSWESKLHLLHFIIPTIYGKGENENRIIPYIINCKKNNKTIELTSGHQIREYIHVSELPKIVEKALDKKIQKGIYNVAGSETIKIKDLVYLLANKMQISNEQINFGKIERWDTGMNILMLDGEKLQKLIDYKPIHLIENKWQEY